MQVGFPNVRGWWYRIDVFLRGYGGWIPMGAGIIMASRRPHNVAFGRACRSVFLGVVRADLGDRQVQAHPKPLPPMERQRGPVPYPLESGPVSE